ncbi:unnamed protein product [Didymodactylos carnosus]|uniref:Uncharacterized protein n=1 Tax=Didymodactylos carnosus TaxID=1234261 RepID=A0A815P3C6_9BILA|nr:unnamed protein product [Didymodactylos carnosus]CAF4318942.1 unnamed protein product [Didymodactylos carnosus]
MQSPNGHFIDKNFVPQACLLDFVRLKGSHNAESLRQTTRRIVERLGLKDKIFRIITDNAASMIKAFQFGLDVELDETNNNANITSSQGSLCDKDDIIDDDECVLQLVNWYPDAHDEATSESLLCLNTKRLSCFAHSLQLTVRDGLKKIPCIKKPLAKCHTLASLAHQSMKIQELLETLSKQIKPANVERWNAELLLIKSIVLIGQNELTEITNATEVIDILDPFYDVTIHVQSQAVVTLSMVVPSIVHLLAHLIEIKTDLALLKAMVKQLQSSLEQRFSGIVKRLQLQEVNDTDPFSDPIYFVAAMLDPSFKWYWMSEMRYNISDATDLKENIFSLIMTECKFELKSAQEKSNSN